jgi:chemotaxis protein MotA
VATDGRGTHPKDRNPVKAITAIGIVCAFGALLLASIMEGTNPMAFMNIPALLLIVGGTSGAVMASTNFQTFMAMPKGMIMSFKGSSVESSGVIQDMVTLAEKARRNGLLALEEDVAKIDDAYTKKGLQLVVDGTDSDLVRTILESEVDGMAQRHGQIAGMFTTAGGFAPTLGIIGTVMGLIHVLENLSAPSTLGPAISGAFIATLYGVSSANLLFLPVGNKLKEMSAAEVNHRYMVLEAILSIQAGDNPRVLAEKLEAYVPPAKRGGGERTTPHSGIVPEEQERQAA